MRKVLGMLAIILLIAPMVFALGGCDKSSPPPPPPPPQTVSGNVQIMRTYAQTHGTLRPDGSYLVDWFSPDNQKLFWFIIDDSWIDFSIAEQMLYGIWLDRISFGYYTINSTSPVFLFDSASSIGGMIVSGASGLGTLTRTGSTTFTTNVVAITNTFSIINNADLSAFAHETFTELQKFLLLRVGIRLFV